MHCNSSIMKLFLLVSDNTMKVKVLKRSPEDFARETKFDIHKIHRNYSPAEHPFEAEREYHRALNAVKLDKVFAKPFLGSLDGHRDTPTCVSKHPLKLSSIASAAADGELRLWDLSLRKCTAKWQGHNGFVRGLAYSTDGSKLLSCADDKTVKFWNPDELSEEPTDTLVCKHMVTGITCQQNGDKFATCGENTQLWEFGRSVPIRTFKWGVDSIHFVKFNPVETNLLGAGAHDNSILLYDTRDVGPVRKVVMTLRSNAMAWNPMEAMVFVTASEDYNLYSWDMRKLSVPTMIYMDHVAAVIDVDYSPTGREIVSGSYDKTIRIFPYNAGRSRDVYHGRRMQKLTSVLWSNDDKYIVSSSDEMNLRLWKARASEKLGILKTRERVSLQYKEKLKEKYSMHPQISRIHRHHHVPKYVLNAKREHAIIKKSKKTREANTRRHSKPGSVPYVSEKKKKVVEES
jgi:WD repeat and SOF domain-containing protein 1